MQRSSSADLKLIKYRDSSDECSSPASDYALGAAIGAPLAAGAALLYKYAVSLRPALGLDTPVPGTDEHSPFSPSPLSKGVVGLAVAGAVGACCAYAKRGKLSKKFRELKDSILESKNVSAIRDAKDHQFVQKPDGSPQAPASNEGLDFGLGEMMGPIPEPKDEYLNVVNDEAQSVPTINGFPEASPTDPSDLVSDLKEDVRHEPTVSEEDSADSTTTEKPNPSDADVKSLLEFVRENPKPVSEEEEHHDGTTDGTDSIAGEGPLTLVNPEAASLTTLSPREQGEVPIPQQAPEEDSSGFGFEDDEIPPLPPSKETATGVEEDKLSATDRLQQRVREQFPKEIQLEKRSSVLEP